MEFKRNIYITSFTLLGLLLGFVIINLGEIFYIKLLLSDFVTYSFGLTWEELIQFGSLLGFLVLSLCGFWGWASGKYWWRQIYVLKKYNHKPWHWRA